MLRPQELERDPLVEGDVTRRDDDAHAALTEDALDAVLAGEYGARKGEVWGRRGLVRHGFGPDVDGRSSHRGDPYASVHAMPCHVAARVPDGTLLASVHKRRAQFRRDRGSTVGLARRVLSAGPSPLV